MLKKILIFGICLLTLNVKAKELPIFTIGSSTAYKGEIVTIPITLKNNPGFSYLGVKIRYDSSKLDYVDSYLTADFSAATLKGIEINDKKTITLYAITSDDTLIKSNGKIAEMKFKILSDKIEDIKIEATIDNFGNNTNSEININKKDGIINIANHGIVGKNEVLEKDNFPENNVTYKSTNDKVASIDKDGNITFNGNGNATIEVIDENGKTIYRKEYKVDTIPKKEQKSNSNKLLYIFLGLFSCIVIISLVFFVRKRAHN